MDFNHGSRDISVNSFSEVFCSKYPKSNDLMISKVQHHSKSDSKITEKELSCLLDANIRLVSHLFIVNKYFFDFLIIYK